MKIRAAVVSEKSGKFTIETLELDDPRDDEVLVKIVGVGICHTDLGGRDHYLPIPPERRNPAVYGHEGAGIVEKVGSRVSKVKKGDHVAISWNYCGKCSSCKAGRNTDCLDFFVHNFNGARPDGSVTLKKENQEIYGSFFSQSSFASHALATERNVVKVDKDVPVEILGTLGCGVSTGAGAVMNSLAPRPGSSIAVFGAGTVGISAILAALVCGCTTVIAVDIHPERLKLAKDMGATHTLNSSKVDPVAEIKKITGGGVEFSLECVGNPKVLRQAVDPLAIGGVCGLLGVTPPGTEVVLNMDLIMNARTVKGIIEGDVVPDLFIPRLIELYKQGKFPYDRLIKYYALDDINLAVEDMEKGVVIKPVLKP